MHSKHQANRNNRAPLGIHHPQADHDDIPRQDPHVAIPSDAVVLQTLVEHLGRDLDAWKLTAAMNAVNSLICRLFDACDGEMLHNDDDAWSRILIISSLLAYRDVLSALSGNCRPMSERLSSLEEAP